MSNPTSFMVAYAGKVQALVTLIQEIRGMNDWIDQDSTLIDRYFAQTGGAFQGGVPRSDIVKADVIAAQGALNQVIFAYDSGSPTQKSKILKMVP